jgi:hypothetical protein
MFYLFGNTNEHLNATSQNILSNESLQNIASVFNNGGGNLTNLKLTGTLQIGNVVFTPNNDGSVSVGGTKISPDGTISFGTNAKILPSGNIQDAIINWTGNVAGGVTWQLYPEGSTMVLRNPSSQYDSRYALFPGGYLDFSKGLTAPGNITSGGSLTLGSGIAFPNNIWMNTFSDGHFEIGQPNATFYYNPNGVIRRYTGDYARMPHLNT